MAATFDHKFDCLFQQQVCQGTKQHTNRRLAHRRQPVTVTGMDAVAVTSLLPDASMGSGVTVAAAKIWYCFSRGVASVLLERQKFSEN